MLVILPGLRKPSKELHVLYFQSVAHPERAAMGGYKRVMLPQEVIFPAPRGREDINNRPDQSPSRWVISFQDFSEDRARTYLEPFQIVEEKVKPDRLKQNDKGGQEYWWRFLRPRNELNTALRTLAICFVTARTTKHLSYSATPTNYVFTDSLNVFTTDRWDLYAVVQSTLHEVWARKYSGALKQDLRYSPSKCFDTFPFPEGQWQTPNPQLAVIGERYHEHRRALMLQLWLGLTDLYNLFHARDLTPALVAKVSKKPASEAEAGYQGILELRRLHRELDVSVRDAYGWSDLDLGHDFHEVETLPENDRVRYTSAPPRAKKRCADCWRSITSAPPRNPLLRKKVQRKANEAKPRTRTTGTHFFDSASPHLQGGSDK